MVVIPTTAEPRVVDLIHMRDYLPGNMLVKEVVDYFKQKNYDFVAVVENDSLSGLVGREMLLKKIGTQFGWALYAEKPISKLADPDAIVVDGSMKATDAMRIALQRKQESVFNDVIVSVSSGYAGLASVRQLMMAHLNALEKKLAQAEAQRDAMLSKNRELIEANMRVLRAGGTNRANVIAESSLPICTFEKDGRLSSANQRFAQLLGIKLNEITGAESVRDLFPGGYDEELEDYLARGDESSETKSLYPLRLRRRNGTLLWVDVAFEFVETTGQLIVSVADIPDENTQEMQNMLDERYARDAGPGQVLARKVALTLRARGLSGDQLNHKISRLAEFADQIESDAPAKASKPSLGMNLQGSLREFGIIDLAQLLVHGGKTGILALGDASKNYRIVFDNGGLVHAESSAGKTGFKVLSEAMQLTDGAFQFQFGEKSSLRTLKGDSMSLLMEACRVTDESRVDSAFGDLISN